MSKNTSIQWCDSTINPTMGCDGCELWNRLKGIKHCYAGNLHDRFGKGNKGYSPTFEELTFWPGRMAEAASWSDLTGKPRKDKPWLDGMPRLIFVSDMSDALSKDVPFEFLEQEIIQNVTSPAGARHVWMWLTKRPSRMAKFSGWLEAKGIGWPVNLWPGTSITTQATVERIKHLLRVGDDLTVKFLSVEPQRESIDIRWYLPQLDLVIQGGESGDHAHLFNLDWARDMIDACEPIGTPCFEKQLGSNPIDDGKNLRFKDSHGGDWSEWPEELRVRQMPRLEVPA